MQMNDTMLVEKEMNEYEVDGFVGMGDGIGALIGIALVAFTFMLVAVVAGKAWSTQETDINNISDANVKQAVKESSIQSFNTIRDTSKQLPLLAVILIFGTLLLFIANLSRPASGLTGGGSAF